MPAVSNPHTWTIHQNTHPNPDMPMGENPLIYLKSGRLQPMIEPRNHNERNAMSIGAIGGVNPIQGHSAAGSISKSEAGEVPGAPDHDGDADDTGTKVSPAATDGTKVAGRVDVKG